MAGSPEQITQSNPNLLAVKFGSMSIATSDGEPRIDKIKAHARDIALVREESGAQVIIVSSGARVFGQRILGTPEYEEILNEDTRDIQRDYSTDVKELRRKLKKLELSNRRHTHRVGQKRLVEIWGNAFAEHGVIVTPELLIDDKDRGLELDLKHAVRNNEIPILNGHGSMEPDGKMRDNDRVLEYVVDLVNPGYVLAIINGTIVDGNHRTIQEI